MRRPCGPALKKHWTHCCLLPSWFQIRPLECRGWDPWGQTCTHAEASVLRKSIDTIAVLSVPIWEPIVVSKETIAPSVEVNAVSFSTPTHHAGIHVFMLRVTGIRGLQGGGDEWRHDGDQPLQNIWHVYLYKVLVWSYFWILTGKTVDRLMLYFTPRNHTEKNMFVFLPADSQKIRRKTYAWGQMNLTWGSWIPVRVSAHPCLTENRDQWTSLFLMRKHYMQLTMMYNTACSNHVHLRYN